MLLNEILRKYLIFKDENMNSRERLLTAIDHKQPDRIPVDLGATPSSGISAVAYHNLNKYLGLDLKNHVYDVLLDRKTLQRGYFRKEGIEQLLEEHLSSRYDHSAKIWSLLFLEVWFRTFIDQGG